MAKLGLDLSGVKASGGSKFTLVPAGKYCVQVTEAEVVQTKKGGYQLVLCLTVKEGDHTGANLREGINIQNENEMATRIGLETVKKIMTVGGHANTDMLGDSDELLSLKLFSVLVGVESKVIDGKPAINVNNIKSYSEYDATSFPPVTQGTSFPGAPAEQTKAISPAKLPWQK